MPSIKRIISTQTNGTPSHVPASEEERRQSPFSATACARFLRRCRPNPRLGNQEKLNDETNLDGCNPLLAKHLCPMSPFPRSPKTKMHERSYFMSSLCLANFCLPIPASQPSLSRYTTMLCFSTHKGNS